jgi:hypothetical protein
MVRTTTVVLMMVAVALGAPKAASAQKAAPSVHDVAVSVGAGTSTELGDWGGSPFTWAVGVRYGLSRHWALEGEGGRWGEARHFDYTSDSNWDSSSTMYPTRRVIDDTQSQWHAAVSVVARSAVRAVSFSGGLGPSLFVQRGSSSMEETRFSDQRHQSWSNSWTNVGVGLLGTGNIDVRLARHVTLFAQVRASLGMMIDTALFGFHAGVRVGF